MILIRYVTDKNGNIGPAEDLSLSVISESDQGKVILVSQDEGALKAAERKFSSSHPGRCSCLLVPADHSPVAQALELVTHIWTLADNSEKPLPIVFLITDALPAALFTCTLASLRKDPPSGCSIEILDPTRQDPYSAARECAHSSHTFIAHKNPKAVVDWQDIEFNFALFDKEEQDSLRQATLFCRSILIHGPKGMGKTLAARFLHFHTEFSAHGNFIDQNMAAVPLGIFDSIFCGMAPGQATGVSGREGLCELATQGTLFLDEVGELPLEVQAKLLRIVSERSESIPLPRVGEVEFPVRDVSPRCISATNRPWSEICSPVSPSIRPDLLARFPVRIHLKGLYDKLPDPWPFFKLAINHYTQLELRHPRALKRIMNWDWDCIKSAYSKRMLPDNLRDLRSFVIQVLENRIVFNKPWGTDIQADEISQALSGINKPNISQTINNELPQRNLSEFCASLNSLLDGEIPTGLTDASEEDVEDLVFSTKRLALQISQWFSNGVIDTGNRIYKGHSSDKKSYKKLLENPNKLHPNPCKRQALRRL